MWITSFVRCLKDYKEVKKYYLTQHIILASFESLDSGISNLILPDILQNCFYDVYYFSASIKDSLIRKIVKNIQADLKYIDYFEIKRVINKEEEMEHEKMITKINEPLNFTFGNNMNKNLNTNMNMMDVEKSESFIRTSSILEEENFGNDISQNNKSINKEVTIKLNNHGKIFSNETSYPMFNYNDTRLIGDFGQVQHFTITLK